MHAVCDVIVCVCCTMIPGNDIGAEGAKALAPALGHLTQLTELNLSCEYCHGCESRGCERTCIMFGWRVYTSRCASVVEALLCWCCCMMTPDNGIGVEGAKALAPALGHLTQLTKLNLFREYCDRCECRGCECTCAWCLLGVVRIQAGVRVRLKHYGVFCVVAR